MRKRVAIALAAVLVLAGIAIVKRHDAVRFVVTHAVALSTGYDVRLSDQRIGLSHAAFMGVSLSQRGRVVFSAPRVDVWYSLRDMLPGSAHRFGLVGIAVEHPTIALVKYPDGTYDVPLPSHGPTLPAPPAPGNPVPLRFFVRVSRAAALLQSEGAGPSTLDVRRFDVSARIDTAGRTHYVVTGYLASASQPILARGTIDVARGYSMQRFTAPALPLSALANMLLNSSTVVVLRGTAHAVDARIFALANSGAPFAYHYSLDFTLDGGRLTLPGLVQPVDAIGGQLALTDDAFTLRALHAKLVGIPLRAEGAIFNFAKPQIRIGVTGGGDMTQLRTAFRFSEDQPLAGPIALGILVEGALSDPSVVAVATSPRMYYHGFPFDALDARVVYYHDIVAFAPLQFRYGGVSATGRGTLDIGDHVRERMDLHFEAPANRLPYVGALLGSEPLSGDANVDGSDLLVRVAGSMAASRGIGDAAAVFDFAQNGVANVAPFWMRAGHGEVDAGFHLDRPDGTSAFWIGGDDVAMRGASVPNALPDVALPQMPSIEGRVHDLRLVGGEQRGAIAMAGSVSAGPTAIASIPFDTLTADFDGTLNGASINYLAATGPWGRFSGSGVFSGTSIVTRGFFDGNLDALEPLIGGVPAHGAARGVLAVGVEPSGIIVQTQGLQLRNAAVDGVPIASADGTLELGSSAVRVYSAHVHAASGDVVASGSYGFHASSRADALAFVAADLDAAALRGAGLPLDRGRLAVTGSLSQGAAMPSFSGVASVANGEIGGYDLAGNATLGFNDERVTFDDVLAGMNGIYGFAHGDIANVTSSAPSLDLHAIAPAGDVASALHSMRVPTYSMEGTFNADLAIGGTTAAPTVFGTVGLPAGSVNGLPFLDGDAQIVAGAGAVSAQNGSVLVGTTRASFDAGVSRDASTIHVRAPSATFSDFNNFFDTGDTLSGSGSVDLNLTTAGSRVATSGHVDVRAFRYRSLPIGDTRANWSSRRNVVRGDVAVGGAEGMLRANGSIALSPQADWQTTLKRSRYAMKGSVDNLDLGLWVSVLGFPQIPLTGRAFGSAQLNGAYPALHLQGEASLRNGTVGRFPIDDFSLRFGSRGRRLAIESAHLVGPGLTADASGTIGVHPTDPVDMHLEASTEDLPAFLAEVTRAHVPISGAFSGSLHVGGNLVKPIFDATFNAQNVHAAGVPISTLFGSVRLQGSLVELYDAGATFARGSARISGDIPLHLQPFSVPENTPVRFTLDAENVDAAVFNAIFGHDTELGGTLATHVALSGTIEDPHMAGSVSVADGSYSSTLDSTPVTKVSGTLAFSGSKMFVQRFVANAGSGSVALSGAADLAGASGPTFNGAMTLRGAQFASPQYGNGTLDGALSLARTTGDALLSGNVTVTNTTVPFIAFVGGAGAGSGGAPLSWPLAFDLNVKAGQNVRVRGSGYGAGLDISGTGNAKLTGTLSSPSLDGRFDSTGGSLTYFDRSFRVLQGAVTFAPADGIVPTLHAVATTTVVNPDPDVARNPFGSATITIDVNGLVNDLKIDFNADPSGYSREQIIAMLAPFGGFISGIQFNPYEVQIPGGAAAAVSNAPVPGGVFVQRNGTLTVSQEAFSILNAQFASSLLAPIEDVLGQTLGVSDVNLTLGYFGNVGVSVRRVLGKTVSAVYSSTFGLPNRQTFGVRFSPNELNDAALSFFYQTGQLRLFETPGEMFGPVLLGQPLEGQSGFSFTFQHFFK